MRLAIAGSYVVLPLAFVLATSPSLTAQTREFLDAPIVKSQIRVAWDTDTKTMTYAVDDDTVFRELTADKLFLTRTSVFVTYPKINPLRVQATAAVTAADDPARATIAQLIGELLGVGKIVGSIPQAAGAARVGGTAAGQKRAATPEGCQALVTANDRISKLEDALYGPNTSPESIEQRVNEWIRSVDSAYEDQPRGDGRAAIRTATVKIDAFVADFSNAIETARRALASIESAAGDKPTDACLLEANTAYHLALLSNPRARIDQVVALKAVADGLSDALTKEYVDHPSRWIDGVNYKISPEIAPSARQMQTIVIRTTNVTFRTPSSATLAVDATPGGSGTLVVRRYSPAAPEIGVGPVFGFLTAPKYGTARNASGDTVVARAPDARLAVTPGVMVNFVWRADGGPFVAPMLQVGASASEEVPAILLGGGLRLFGAGKGDVAIGGGLLAGWVKDLRTLREGSVVSGTTQIQADLGYTSRFSGYFVIQYKF